MAGQCDKNEGSDLLLSSGYASLAQNHTLTGGGRGCHAVRWSAVVESVDAEREETRRMYLKLIQQCPLLDPRYT